MEKYHDELIALRTGQAVSKHTGDYWSEDEQDTLNRLFWTGHGISEIAMILQRNEMAICQQLIRRNMLSQQSKPRSRKERAECNCYCARCTNKDCPRCGKEKPDAGDI